MSDPSGTLIGVVILARHGDREGFFQDPLTYTASATSITPLGNVSSLTFILVAIPSDLPNGALGTRVPVGAIVPIDVLE